MGPCPVSFERGKNSKTFCAGCNFIGWNGPPPAAKNPYFTGARLPAPSAGPKQDMNLAIAELERASKLHLQYGFQLLTRIFQIFKFSLSLPYMIWELQVLRHFRPTLRVSRPHFPYALTGMWYHMLETDHRTVGYKKPRPNLILICRFRGPQS